MRSVAAEKQQAALVEPTSTIQQASAAMLDAGVEIAIVVDGADVRGLVSAEDIAGALTEGRSATATAVEAVIGADPLVVDENEPLAEVRQLMRARGCPTAVIVGDGGRPVGVLADPQAAP